MQKISESARVLSQDFLKFVDKSISPYHATREAAVRLLQKGEPILN